MLLRSLSDPQEVGDVMMQRSWRKRKHNSELSHIRDKSARNLLDQVDSIHHNKQESLPSPLIYPWSPSLAPHGLSDENPLMTTWNQLNMDTLSHGEMHPRDTMMQRQPSSFRYYRLLVLAMDDGWYDDFQKSICREKVGLDIFWL
jgi:hypothetical protein